MPLLMQSKCVAVFQLHLSTSQTCLCNSLGNTLDGSFQLLRTHCPQTSELVLDHANLQPLSEWSSHLYPPGTPAALMWLHLHHSEPKQNQNHQNITILVTLSNIICFITSLLDKVQVEFTTLLNLHLICLYTMLHAIYSCNTNPITNLKSTVLSKHVGFWKKNKYNAHFLINFCNVTVIPKCNHHVKLIFKYINVPDRRSLKYPSCSSANEYRSLRYDMMHCTYIPDDRSIALSSSMCLHWS